MVYMAHTPSSAPSPPLCLRACVLAVVPSTPPPGWGGFVWLAGCERCIPEAFQTAAKPSQLYLPFLWALIDPSRCRPSDSGNTVRDIRLGTVCVVLLVCSFARSPPPTAVISCRGAGVLIGALNAPRGAGAGQKSAMWACEYGCHLAYSGHM